MSLKHIHVAFIVLSMAIAAGFGLWAARHGTALHLAAAALSFGSAGLLVGYLRRFVRKARALVALAAVLRPDVAWACPVCFGETDSPLASGVAVGVLLLLGVTASMLGAFGAFFVSVRRRARQVEQNDSKA